MSLQNILTNIGLSGKEAKIYLAALELGPSPASDLALRAKLNRVTTYDTLKNLTTTGFISKSTKNKITIFTATEPDHIRQDVRKKYMDLKEALPDLRRLAGKTVHPHVRHYEGTEAIKKIYTDTLSAKTEILNYANSKLIRDFWPSYDKDYVNERVKKRIYLRGIAPSDEHGRRVIQENEKKYREIRLVPAGPFSFMNEINIYDDKVSIISFSAISPMGMIIESAEIASTQRAIFMMAWEFAGQISEK